MGDRTRWVLLAAAALALVLVLLWQPWSTTTLTQPERGNGPSEPGTPGADPAHTRSPDRPADHAEALGAASRRRSKRNDPLGLPLPEAGLAGDVGSSWWSSADSALAAAGPLRSLSSDERVDPVIANTCSVPVELYWVDFDGVERSYGTLRAGTEGALSTYRGHAWRIRTLDGRELRSFVAEAGGIEACDAEHAPAAAAVTAERPRREWPEHVSARSMERARISIRNACEDDLELFWVDFRGDERRYASLPSGAEIDQSTFRGHLWRLRTADGREVQSFRAEGDGAFAACESLELDRDA